jgi:hypothetical protein
VLLLPNHNKEVSKMVMSPSQTPEVLAPLTRKVAAVETALAVAVTLIVTAVLVAKTLLRRSKLALLPGESQSLLPPKVLKMRK